MDFISRNGAQSKLYNFKSAIESEQYMNWQQSQVRFAINAMIYQEYINYSENKTASSTFIRFDIKEISGACSLFKMSSGISLQDLIYHQLQTADNIKKLGYIINLSEIKHHADHEYSLILYQKPSFRLPPVNDKSNQLYGNIHTEIRIKDDHLVFYKMIVHRYNDFRFDEGLPFDELISALFKN